MAVILKGAGKEHRGSIEGASREGFIHKPWRFSTFLHNPYFLYFR